MFRGILTIITVDVLMGSLEGIFHIKCEFFLLLVCFIVCRQSLRNRIRVKNKTKIFLFTLFYSYAQLSLR